MLGVYKKCESDIFIGKPSLMEYVGQIQKSLIP